MRPGSPEDIEKREIRHYGYDSNGEGDWSDEEGYPHGSAMSSGSADKTRFDHVEQVFV